MANIISPNDPNIIFCNTGIGFLQLKDFTKNGRLNIGSQKSIVLLYSNLCGHCKKAKRDFIRLDTPGVDKFVIDCTNDSPFIDRIPDLFEFELENFTVPQFYLFKNGQRLRKLKDLTYFSPNF